MAEAGSPPVKWRAAKRSMSSKAGGANSAVSSFSERNSCSGRRDASEALLGTSAPRGRSSCSSLRAAARKPSQSAGAVSASHSLRSMVTFPFPVGA